MVELYTQGNVNGPANFFSRAINMVEMVPTTNLHRYWDLSPSMLAQDLSPDRLTRAKFKLIDMLRQQRDGQTALIAYAGEAHTVSPLSDDPKTIEALLPALHPNVMPVRGSNTEAAVELAQQLLSDAGLHSGDILLITDGIANDAITDIRNSINSNYRVSVLAVGGNDATPIPSPNGG